MKLPKLRELREAITAVFSRRYTSRFPKKPHKAAEGYRGKPVPDDDWCIGCEACCRVCPTGAIEIEDSPEKSERVIKRLYDRCVFCGQCELLCPQPEPGVRMTGEYDMADYRRDRMKSEQRFNLMVCSKCKNPVATEKQLLSSIEKMGPALAAASPEMLLARQKGIGMGSPPVIKRKYTTRADIFIFLCPSCRHEVYRTEAEG